MKTEQQILAECTINHSVAMNESKESIAEYDFDDWCNVLIPIIQEKERWETLYQKEAEILSECRNELMNRTLELTEKDSVITRPTLEGEEKDNDIRILNELVKDKREEISHLVKVYNSLYNEYEKLKQTIKNR